MTFSFSIFITIVVLIIAFINYTAAAAVQVHKTGETNVSVRYVCDCPQWGIPVCGSDKVSYPNKCLFDCRNVEGDLVIENEGLCKPEYYAEDTVLLKLNAKNACTDKCNRSVDPVCGSNMVTYQNPCMFRCARILNPKLVIKHRGAC